MAGLPLKSGADFYNLEAARLRLHNLGADPTEVGAGLIYFNTSTGLNTSQKARLYTGSAWKTIAFSEDLDVASNADFLALKDKVDTLIGDGVDMDGIIESWKEVEAFLSGMSDTKNLMDLLNGKLNTSGGTINGNLAVSSGTISSLRTSTRRAVFYKNASESVDSGTYIVDVSDSGDAVLKLTYNDLTWKGNTLLHSGNIGEYAMNVNKKLNIQTSVNEAGYAYTSDGWATSGAAFTIGSSSDYRMAFQGDYGSSFGTRLQYNYCYGGEWKGWKTIAFTDSNVAGAYKLVTSSGADAVTIGSNGLELHSGFIGYKDGDTLRYFGVQGSQKKLRFYDSTEWKDIAFIDSNVVSAQALKHSNGTVGATVGSSGAVTFYKGSIFQHNDKNVAYFGSAQDGIGESNDGALMFTYGERNLYFYTNSTQRMLINSSGNVTIGGSDLAGSDAKLYVDGSVTMKKQGDGAELLRFGTERPWHFIQKGTGSGTSLMLSTTQDNKTFEIGDVNNKSIIQFYASSTTPVVYVDAQLLPLTNNAHRLGSNVARWSTIYGVNGNFSGNMTIDGDLHVTGNIIADGEVSAGGAAEEGGNAGGDGAFHSDIIKVGATQTTIAHGLGTDDIVVSIYEKDGVSGRWSIILTDVEIVDANNIIVSFGSATTVEHKVVIMGAVA